MTKCNVCGKDQGLKMSTYGKCVSCFRRRSMPPVPERSTPIDLEQQVHDLEGVIAEITDVFELEVDSNAQLLDQLREFKRFADECATFECHAIEVLSAIPGLTWETPTQLEDNGRAVIRALWKDDPKGVKERQRAENALYNAEYCDEPHSAGAFVMGRMHGEFVRITPEMWSVNSAESAAIRIEVGKWGGKPGDGGQTSSRSVFLDWNQFNSLCDKMTTYKEAWKEARSRVRKQVGRKEE